MLKLTIVANYNHGAFSSGDRLFNKIEIFSAWLNKQPDTYFEELSEDMSLDHGDPVSAETAKAACDDFMASPAITNRLEFVTCLCVVVLLDGGFSANKIHLFHVAPAIYC